MFMVSPIGFGAFKIGRNVGIKYEEDYDLPDDAAIDRLLNAVLDAGINLIDTAPAYGVSEARIGQFLAHRRDEFVLSTKVGETFTEGRSIYDFSKAATEASIARSLRRLKMDTLDIVLIHSDGADLHILTQTDVVPTLQALKAKGDIRAIGFSGKTVAGAARALDWADVLMVEYHNEDTSHDEVMREAHARGVGVLIKKGLASGRLDPSRAIPFILRHPAVSSMVIGMLDPDHMRTNVRIAEKCA